MRGLEPERKRFTAACDAGADRSVPEAHSRPSCRPIICSAPTLADPALHAVQLPSGQGTARLYGGSRVRADVIDPVRGIVVLTAPGSARIRLATFRSGRHLVAGPHRGCGDPGGVRPRPARVHAFYNARRGTGGAASAERGASRAGRTGADMARPVPARHAERGRPARTGRQRAAGPYARQARAARCLCCDAAREWTGSLWGPLARLRDAGGMRPDVVWFGEMPRDEDRIEAALAGVRPSSRSEPQARSIRRRVRRPGSRRRAHVELNL